MLNLQMQNTHVNLNSTFFTNSQNSKIKSPLNYIGGKYKLLSQILPLFPQNIGQFVDLFAGGCNVGINVNAEKIYFNDNLVYLIEMFTLFQKVGFDYIISHINEKIKNYQLSKTNQDGFLKLRADYNKTKKPLDLFVLISYSFNHQIRFNNSHEYNNPFGRKRSSFNDKMKFNLQNFISKLNVADVEFSAKCFTEFDFSILNEDSFVYCDPPYLISNGTYNDGKRGFKGWTPKEEKELLETLDGLNAKNIKFGLSNVLEHKGKSNRIIQDWLEKNKNYKVNRIKASYSNSNYQTKVRNENSSTEVLITNYEPVKPQLELFSF